MERKGRETSVYKLENGEESLVLVNLTAIALAKFYKMIEDGMKK